MANRGARELYRDLDLIAGSGTAVGLSDAELLGRFAGRRGDAAEAAFEAIVARHGPMVLGVCRSVLRRPIDADDAFQATFLVLVKKAGSVRVADSLAPWLYGVARRVAVKARAAAQKRRARETSIEAADGAPSETDADAFDVRPILFEELDRLPEKYRSPVVLCHLEGLSHEEAARRLRWPVGTLSGRLSRARGLLRSRLERRGLGASAALSASALPTSRAITVPPALLRSTLQSATALTAGGPLADSILSLYQGVVTAMFVHKLKAAAIVGAMLATFAAAAGYASGQIGVRPPAPVPEVAGAPKPEPNQEVKTPVLVNPFKDPLKTPRIVNDAILVVMPKDRRSVTAMVIDQGDWQEYRAPEGVSIVPMMGMPGGDRIASPGGEVLALAPSGDEIRELAAFSAVPTTHSRRGKWIRQPLREPAKGRIWPLMGRDWACYQVGSDIYVFSGGVLRWDVLHLEGAEPVRIVGDRTSILAEQGDTLYVFSVAAGKWSKGLKVPSPEAK